MDPLSVLREFATNKNLDQIVVDGSRIKFGDKYAFPKNCFTGYKRHGSGSDTYDLHTLVYFLEKSLNIPWLEYVRSARSSGIPQVAFPDRKELMDYLLGRIERSDKIQMTAPELHLTAAAEEEDLEPSLKRARLEPTDGSATVAELKEARVAPVIGRERQLRDRNDQMKVPFKNFKDVLSIIKIAQDQHAARKKQAVKAATKPPPQVRHQQHRKGNLSLPSQRFDQPVEQKSLGAFNLGHKPQAQPPPPPPPDRSHPPPQRPSSSNHSMSHQQHRSHSSHKKPSKASDREAELKAAQAKVPIVIVPAAPSAKITMLNVKEFLENGAYKSNEEARKEGAKKEAKCVIARQTGRPKPVPYEITDRTPTKAEWPRVVAVFVTGAAWQFKGWPLEAADKGDMASLFHTVLGIHVGMKNEVISENLKSWNIKHYKLHPDNRHGDKSVVVDLFNSIDKFLSNKNRGKVLKY